MPIRLCWRAKWRAILKIPIMKEPTYPVWDVSEMSQSYLHWERHLKDLSETFQKRRLFCDVFKTSQIHLKKCLFWDVFKTSQIHLKKCLFWDVFKTSQIHLRKDVFFVTSFRRLKYISKKMLFYVKIDVRTLKTLKKWNVVFWEQCIANNQSVMSISGLMIACSLLLLAVLLC